LVGRRRGRRQIVVHGSHKKHWLFTWNFGVMASGTVVTITVIVTPDRGPAAGEVMDDASEVPHASDAQRWCRPGLAENGARGRHHLGHEGEWNVIAPFTSSRPQAN
jgi:hypothetical protein